MILIIYIVFKKNYINKINRIFGKIIVLNAKYTLTQEDIHVSFPLYNIVGYHIPFKCIPLFVFYYYKYLRISLYKCK